MIRSLLNRGPRVRINPEGWHGRTKQSMRDECNVNLIVAKYQKTGAISHFSKFGAKYGFAPALDFREAMELTREASAMFLALPSSVRKRFDNDPASFLEFAQDPANAEEMVKLGLAQQRDPSSPRQPSSPVAPVVSDSGAPG